MDELTRTLAPLVEHPPAAPTDLATIAARATARRRARWTVGGGVAGVLIAAVAVTATALVPPATPTIDPVGRTPVELPTSAPGPGDGQGEDVVVPSAPPETDPRTLPSPPPRPSEETEPDPYAGVREVGWTDDAGRVRWQQDNGRDGLWVAGFFRSEDAVSSGREEPATRFWARVGDEAEDLPRDEFLRLALDTLTARPPDGYASAVAGADLRLTSADLRGEELALDHPEGTVLTDNGYGSAGAMEFAAQYLPLLRHYYPEAATACISIDGVESREDGPYILHDGIGCPWDLR